MTDDPKVVVNRLINDVINAHRPDLVHEVMHPKIRIGRMGMQRSAQFLAGGHVGGLVAPPPSQDPIESFKGAFAGLLKSFPDVRNNLVGVQISEGNTVISQITFSGTHKGTFLGVEPTNKYIEVDEFLVHRVTDGLVSEAFALGDELGFLQQLGVLPAAMNA